LVAALSFIEPKLADLLRSQFAQTRDEGMREPYLFSGFEAKSLGFQLVTSHRAPPFE